MPSSFFKIGSYDLTPYIDIQNYLVNAQSEYEEWTDADNILHRKFLRKRCQGSFQMGFDDPLVFDAMLAELADRVTEDGYYTVSAYVSNEGAVRTVNVYLDLENVDDKFDQVNGRQWTVTEVTVMER